VMVAAALRRTLFTLGVGEAHSIFVR